MLDTKGDTLVYQLYSWVRIKNLFRKTEFSINQIKEFNIIFSKIDVEYKIERNLVLHLTQFDEIIKKVSDTLLPNYLCEYIYQMSIKINEFWRDCKVLNNDYEKSRLKICLATKITMKKCLDLLGIPVDQI
jgi:arginyl-tRNA synthetase